MSRSVWKQANVASDLWEKLTARCVDRHRSETFLCIVYILYRLNVSAVIGSKLIQVLYLSGISNLLDDALQL